MAAATTTGAASATYTPIVVTSFPRIPLTTTFTPPADCSGFYEPTASVGVIDPYSSCLPSGFTAGTANFFSPGFVCPSGYSTACHDTQGVSSITTVNCCPVRGDISLSCGDFKDEAHTNAFWGTFFCTWYCSKSTTITMTLSSSSGVTSTTPVAFTPGMGLNAYGVRMAYESTDVPTTSGSTTATGSTSSSSSSATGGSQSTSGGTSGGTIAVAVVIPIVALAILGALFLWWRKRRQRKGAVAVEAPSGTPKYYSSVPSGEPKMGELPVETSRRGELPGEPILGGHTQEPIELQ
ncbi:hypothetical protein N431DRAFT_548225 [Stipitochalara longipes BDJ]|nr:hypothetical protein N431DRAFT_548225 [Stipitochalara longipes BDJ]